ncbi:MAG: hypothetical protein ACJ8CR_19870 [Roseiflexaceae bacterium]
MAFEDEEPGLRANPLPPPEIQAQIQHLEALCTEHIRRLRVLEWQLARLSGIYAPSHLFTDREAIRAEIADIKEQIKKLWNPNLPTKEIGVLTAEQIDLRQTLADMLGIAINDIDIFSADEGSVIVSMVLPLDAAAQLLALHRAGHPWAARAHIIDVQLYPQETREDADQVERLTATEQERLRAADPMADPDTRLLLEALPLVSNDARRNALLTQIDERLAKQRAAQWQPTPKSESPDDSWKGSPELVLPDGKVRLRVTFSDAVRQAA